MRKKVALGWATATAVLVLGACSSSSSAPQQGATCGDGTVLDGGTCIAVSYGSDSGGSDSGVTCGAGTVLVSGMCVADSDASPSGDAGSHAEAGSDAGAAACGTGTHACSGVCYADDDSMHCGSSCGACSGSTPACTGGACACTASSCPTGQACVAGACVAAACAGSGACTGGLCCRGACVPAAECCTASDCAPPGACQTAATCTANKCVYANVTDGTACNGTSTCCAGSCVDLTSDKFDCGSCGNACYGGNAAAACTGGTCAELVTETDDSAGAAYPNRLGTPTIVVDATNVYFLAPGDGQVLQAPKAMVGNTAPTVVVTEGGGDAGTLDAISAIAVDGTTLYYNSFGAGATRSVPIGGGPVTTYPNPAVVNCVPEQTYIAVDATNVYVANQSCLEMAPKAGGALVQFTRTSSGTNACGLAADGTNVYWAACGSTMDNISYWSVAGNSTGQIVTGETGIQNMALGPTAAYWSINYPPDYPIRTAPISGAAASNLVAHLSGAASTLAVDPATGAVYWVEGGLLKKVAAGGGQPVTLASIPGSAAFGTLAVDGSDVYFTVTATVAGKAGVQVWRTPK